MEYPLIISVGLVVFAFLWARPWLRPPGIWRLSRQHEVMMLARGRSGVLPDGLGALRRRADGLRLLLLCRAITFMVVASI